MDNETHEVKISQTHKLYDYFISNGKRVEDYQRILEANVNLNHLVNNSKSEYYNRLSSKLVDHKTSSKAYWTILKSIFAVRRFLRYHLFL